MPRDAASTSEHPTCAECRGMGFPVSGTLADLEAELGHDVLIAFLKAHGGRVADIPTRAAATPCSDPVTRALDWLRREIGHGRWDVPLGPVADNVQRAWTMLKLFRAGASLRAVAVELGCSGRAVSRRKTAFIRRGLLPVSGRTTRDTKGDTGR